MVVIVDMIANIVWVGYPFCAFKASFNFYPKLLVSHHLYNIKINLVHYLSLSEISLSPTSTTYSSASRTTSST